MGKNVSAPWGLVGKGVADLRNMCPLKDELLKQGVSGATPKRCFYTSCEEGVLL